MTEPVMVTPVKGGGDNSRVIKMAAAGGVLVLALFVGPKVLGGGGGGGGTDDALLSAPPTSVPAAPAPDAHDIESAGTMGGRNPFTPLLDLTAGSEEAAPAATSGSGPEVLPPIESFDVFPQASDTGVEEPSATPTPVVTTPPPPPPTHRLSLLEVYVDSAGRTGGRVRVDDDVIETLVGQDFGGNYRVVSLDRQSGCGVFLYGDQRITLCEGQEAIT
jgi:hypothetical protein